MTVSTRYRITDLAVVKLPIRQPMENMSLEENLRATVRQKTAP
jgi:hypothetical protein